MNKLLIVSFLVFVIGFNINAQNIGRQSVGVSGSNFFQSNTEVTFTIGEVFISNYTTPGEISEGFNQGDIELTTGLPILKELSDLKIFPNPAHSKLFISSSTQNINEFFIYDLKGRVIMKKKGLLFSGLLEININDLEPGYYILKMMDDSDKIIVNQNLIKF